MLTMSLMGDSGFFGDFGATATPAALRVQAQKYRALAAKAKTAKLKASYLAKAVTAEAKAAQTTGPATEARSGVGHFKTLPKGATTGPATEAKSGAGHFKTVVAARKAAVVAKAVAATTLPAVMISKDVAKRLQAALVMLGKIAGSAQLKAVKVDGSPGAKTAAAVNFAFTKHLGPGQALPQYRTGRMPLDYIKANATVLTSLLETEIKRRGGTPAAAATIAKTQAASRKIATSHALLSAKAKAAAAKKKKAAAKAKAAALRATAATKRRQAAALRASNPAAAQALEDQATQSDIFATDADKETVTAGQEESIASEATQAAATATEETAAAASAEAAQAAQTALSPSAAPPGLPAEAPGGPTEASMIPSAASGSFLDKYKYPLIGGVALLGLLAVLTNKKPPAGVKKPVAPGMNGARRRRSHGRR